MHKELCHRCTKPVYPTDKVGPLKDSSFFHRGCFKCYICGTRLALKTYCNNRNNIHDREVYCKNHVPNASPHDSSPHVTNGVGNAPMTESTNKHIHPQNWPDAGVQDLKIQAAMKATQIAKPYPKIKHEGAKYVVDYDAQTRLELMHRKAEDQLYKQMEENRLKEMKEFEEETREEWERALSDFAKRYEQGRANKNHEEELMRQLTIKRDQKLETIHSKRRERERMLTSDLVDKQAKEMLELFRQSRYQYNLDKQSNNNNNNDYDVEETNSSCGGTSSYSSYPATPPPPVPPPPSCSKKHICAENEIFEQIDQIAVNIAHSEVTTFTDLVRTLTMSTKNDIEKARAIYRWITVKNLNVMVFDEDLDNDTPLGLLRGIKHGTESYHVLFKRLCSYAGLHCCVIKGYSKSAGYQPGMRFEDGKFRNTWNAVFLDGSWRFVQCNWGARHLVNAKDGTRTPPRNGITKNGHDELHAQSSNLRYEFDDHYFCTDPDFFIYEFFPQDPEWQLLPRPITLEQFEQLPFVRSLFFRYGLRFTDPRITSVIRTDVSGAATVSITTGPETFDNLIFHYSLRAYENDETEFDGINLKRFVMQSVTDEAVFFRVHCPTTKPLLLDIFSNIVSTEHYLLGHPIKFKSVCKFKISCESLNMIMVPLPNCAGGEWGPAKAYRLFNLFPITHPDSIINCSQYCEIKFKMLKPLMEFVTTLHQNGIESKHLSRCSRVSTEGDEVTIYLELPDEGLIVSYYLLK